MPDEPDEFIPTRRSLLARLKNWDDQESWQDFFNTYWRLIYSVAIKAGLSDTEAQDVVQETILVVAKKTGEFKSDPTIGSFKGWLMLITRRRIAEQFEKRNKVGQASGGGADAVKGTGGTPVLPSDDSTRTSTIERVPDPASINLDACWEEEWQKTCCARRPRKSKTRSARNNFRCSSFMCCANGPWERLPRPWEPMRGRCIWPNTGFRPCSNGNENASKRACELVVRALVHPGSSWLYIQNSVCAPRFARKYFGR